jgi:hypothetical protein
MIVDPAIVKLVVTGVDALDWPALPEKYRHGLRSYIEHGARPGSFLSAVLENDLRQSMGRADVESRRDLFAIVVWLHNEAPAIVWGSAAHVSDWLEAHAERRRAAEQATP